MSEERNSIQLLSSDVVDQIAAGEVVERPAHLVKELVENAIDAGAESIEVEYDQGGRRVRVTDDGRGIAAGELKLALSRHATSKIRSADDLWSLHSFGFRGEALASIAAVSRLSLQSRTSEAGTCSRIVSEFGKLSDVEPTGGNPGTTILIEELFSNVPARLKFMKTESGESAQIKATLKALALANECVEFRLKTKGKIEHRWPRAASFLERARQVLGGSKADDLKLYENQMAVNGFEAHVVFAGPHDVTGNSKSILTFVQGRWVQDRGLQAAVTEAFRGLLMHGEYPIAVVRLKVPQGEVDVNIHPTKSQIKFRDSSNAFRAVNRCLREAIEKAPWLVMPTNPPKTPLTSVLESSSASYPERSTAKLSVADLTRPYDGGEKQTPANEPQAFGPFGASAPVHSVGRFEAPEFNAVVFKQKTDHEAEPARAAGSAANASLSSAAGPWSRLQVLGQAHLTYILAQDSDRLVLIDQHAAHERVAYERLMRAWLSGGADVQSLLLPISIELEADGAEHLVAISEELEKLGVIIDQVGPQAIAVRAKPALISDGALTKALKELAREIGEKGGSFHLENKISDLCATMACHSVVRAGQALSNEQMRRLLVQMDEFSLSSFCPHGRPVSVDYTFAKLERDFGRIV